MGVDRAILPDLRGRRVLDLGCGFGWFSRWAAENGAAEVVGLDVSELARARADTVDPRIRYEIADLETLDLHGQSFDLAYSSLAFHYVEDFPRLVATLYAGLNDNADLVFSIEHPIYLAPTRPEWLTGDEGLKIWPLDKYSIEGRRVTNLLADGVVKFHRTMGSTLNALIAVGFRICHVEEWCPSEQQIAANPELSEELERPMFLIVRARR